jgi:hypothetical protein
MGNILGRKPTNKKYNDNLLSTSKNNIPDSTSEEYFNIIKKKLRRFYEENQENPINLAISLERRDFFTVSNTSKRYSISGKYKFIHWKDYLTEYLKKKTAKGYIWTSDLIE